MTSANAIPTSDLQDANMKSAQHSTMILNLVSKPKSDQKLDEKFKKMSGNGSKTAKNKQMTRPKNPTPGNDSSDKNKNYSHHNYRLLDEPFKLEPDPTGNDRETEESVDLHQESQNSIQQNVVSTEDDDSADNENDQEESIEIVFTDTESDGNMSDIEEAPARPSRETTKPRYYEPTFTGQKYNYMAKQEQEQLPSIEYTRDNAKLAAMIITKLNAMMMEQKDLNNCKASFAETYSIKKGIKKWGKKAWASAVKEMRQLHDRVRFKPEHKSRLSQE